MNMRKRRKWRRRLIEGRSGISGEAGKEEGGGEGVMRILRMT